MSRKGWGGPSGTNWKRRSRYQGFGRFTQNWKYQHERKRLLARLFEAHSPLEDDWTTGAHWSNLGSVLTSSLPKWALRERALFQWKNGLIPDYQKREDRYDHWSAEGLFILLESRLHWRKRRRRRAYNKRMSSQKILEEIFRPTPKHQKGAAS